VKRDSITIVLVSKSREPLTMEFSVKEMILTCTLLLLLLGASIYSLVNYKNLRNHNYRLNTTVQSLKADLREREGLISELKRKFEEQKNLVMIVERQDTAAVSPGSNNGEIRIEGLRVEALEQGLSLDFRLLNTAPEEKVLSGYLMVIVEHQSGDYDKFGTFPEFTLTSGQPIDYLEGDTYAIRNFKRVTTEIPLSEEPEKYASIKFLIFNENGEILLYDNRALQW